MRRSLALVLTLLFSWLLIVPIASASSDSTQPACCRKNGKHHCLMGSADSLMGSADNAPSSSIAVVSEKCSRCPHATVASPFPFSDVTRNAAIAAGLVAHPAIAPQAEASYRISYDRSRQKRGPPSLLLS